MRLKHSNDVRGSGPNSTRGWRRGARLGIGIVTAALAACAVLLAAPQPALADDYEMSRTVINATVQPDGVLDVVEDRTFDFDGEFHGVYWEIGTGFSEGEQVEARVQSVGIVGPDGAFTPFTEDSFGAQLPHTYTVEDTGNLVRVTLYNDASYEDVTYRVVYDLVGAINAWADTGELYWKFVSDGWDVMSDDVTCTVHLPVPAGEEVVPGENVRAWGHGSLDSTVSFSGDDVIYQVPGVGTDQFAEARIAFPLSWLTMPARSEAKLQTIISEEEAWAEEANAQRAQARAITYGATGVVAGGGAAAIIFAAATSASYKKRHRSSFHEKYWRDVPSHDHPAMVGALVNGEPGAPELTATLMRLTDQRAIGLDHVSTTKHGIFGSKAQDDYRLRQRAEGAATVSDPIDEAALDFLFDFVAPKTPTFQEMRDEAEAEATAGGAGGDFEPVLDFSEMKGVAKEFPNSYAEALDDWRSTVKAQVEAKGYLSDEAGKQRSRLYAVAVICVFLAVAGFIAFIALEPPVWFLLFLILPIVGAVVCGVVASRCEGYSEEADEIRAKAFALRAWLKDFTRIDEAVPDDVRLWNQLLVYAVILGVADEVIDQLRVAMPHVVDDPYFYPYYVWYWGYGGPWSPMRALGDAYQASYTASTGAVATSANASGAGAGGGFSMGGGGGVGGGGGGGAF